MNCPMCKTPCERSANRSEVGVTIEWRCPRCSKLPVDYSRIGAERGSVRPSPFPPPATLFECVRLLELVPADPVVRAHAYMAWGCFAGECAALCLRIDSAEQLDTELSDRRGHLRNYLRSLVDTADLEAFDRRAGRQEGGTDARR